MAYGEAYMDAFKVGVIVAILVSWAALGFISYVTTDAIQGAKIPDQEYGMVVSKGMAVDGELARYTVSLANSKTLYIINNSTLYDSIQTDLSYLFNCHIDYTNKMTIIDNALQVNRTAT